MRGVVANALDCDIMVNDVDLQSPHNIHFRTNTHDQVIEPPYPFCPSYVLNSNTIVL